MIRLIDQLRSSIFISPTGHNRANNTWIQTRHPGLHHSANFFICNALSDPKLINIFNVFYGPFKSQPRIMPYSCVLHVNVPWWNAEYSVPSYQVKSVLFVCLSFSKYGHDCFFLPIMRSCRFLPVLICEFGEIWLIHWTSANWFSKPVALSNEFENMALGEIISILYKTYFVWNCVSSLKSHRWGTIWHSGRLIGI